MHYEKFTDGTIKCIEDEIPFEIPDSWSWTRIGNAFATLTGNTPKTDDKTLYGDEYPFYKPADLDVGYNVYDSKYHVSRKGFLSGRIVLEDSVLVTCIGATIGKVGLIQKSGICNQQINAIIPNNFIKSEYIYELLCSYF